jgi:hypothetical protein
MLVKANEGWTDQHLSAALSLLEEKSSLFATAEKHVLRLMVIIDAPWHRVVEELAQMIGEFCTSSDEVPI